MRTDSDNQETEPLQAIAEEAHISPKKPLWKRWLGWGGSFFIISLLLHVILLGGATILVVQVVQGRKEKLKFTAPPPSPAGPKSVEHKVKMAKKAASMSAPAISKRITSTAANASIALPAMEMTSSSGPDVMASVMSGLGGNGLGSGVGTGGGGGMTAMPLAGMTAFGFKGVGAESGLKGTLYDFKQLANKQPSDLKPTVGWDKQAVENGRFYCNILDSFISKGWDENVLQQYFHAQDQLVSYQVFIPTIAANPAMKEFGVEKEVKPGWWLIHYKGKVVAPKDGMYRFVGVADNVMGVRFDKRNVFWADRNPAASTAIGVKFFSYNVSNAASAKPKPLPTPAVASSPTPDGSPKSIPGEEPTYGQWFTVERGKTYEIEVIVGEWPGTDFQAILMIEEKNPTAPYPVRTANPKFLAYPVFQLKKGIPIPPYKAPVAGKKELAPEVAPESVVFQGVK